MIGPVKRCQVGSRLPLALRLGRYRKDEVEAGSGSVAAVIFRVFCRDCSFGKAAMQLNVARSCQFEL